MPVTRQESHQISVYAGQGEVAKLRSLVHDLAEREGMTTAEVLLASKDDYHQTAAHIAAKAGQTRSIEALAALFNSSSSTSNEEQRAAYFNTAHRFTGDRPVHAAMRQGFLDAFRALIAAGADPTVRNRFGDAVTDYETGEEFGPEEVQAVVDAYLSAESGGEGTEGWKHLGTVGRKYR